jgi:hypothetical protein
MDGMRDQVARAVSAYWRTRDDQTSRQKAGEHPDQGARAAATGGKQMDGFVQLVSQTLTKVGIPDESIFTQKRFQLLPGFFRPTKEWDLLVVVGGKLLLALEAKSHVGPSFGNNFNNRTEEAMGSALDLWTAFREGAFGSGPAPWLGYLLLLEDCPASRRPVRAGEPHFEVFPEFKGASYATRYELFCKKLVLERHYTAAAFLLSDRVNGPKGGYSEPARDLTVSAFIKAFVAHAKAFAL